MFSRYGRSYIFVFIESIGEAGVPVNWEHLIWNVVKIRAIKKLNFYSIYWDYIYNKTAIRTFILSLSFIFLMGAWFTTDSTEVALWAAISILLSFRYSFIGPSSATSFLSLSMVISGSVTYNGYSCINQSRRNRDNRLYLKGNMQRNKKDPAFIIFSPEGHFL